MQAEIDYISVRETDLPEQRYNLRAPYGASLSTHAKWKSACPDKEASVSRVSVGAAAFHIEFDDRELVIEVRDLSVISEDGQNLLLDLMRKGVRFRSSGVFAGIFLECVSSDAMVQHAD
jgi:hypothetical protein